MGYKEQETVQTTLCDRISKLLESYEWSDCSFNVSGRNFKAHRLILGISSPVFKAMFYGPLSSSDDIIISDIEPDIFQLLISFIYTDKVVILTIEHAFELLYAAKKYLIENLAGKCLQYIEANLSVDNVIYVLNFAEYIQEKSILESSLNLFCEHAEFLLYENIEKINCTCLKIILTSDNINISEKNLIKFVFKWTKSYCKLNGQSETLENRRAVLHKNNLMILLRFPVLNEQEFAEILVDNDNLLLAHEIENIMSCITASDCRVTNDDNNIVLKPDVKSRSGLKVKLYICHRSSLRSAAPLVIDANNNKIDVRLKVDKTVFVNSLCVPTRMSPQINFHTNNAKLYSEQFSVTVTRESDNQVIKFMNFMNTVEYDSNVFIEFSDPCILVKEEWHKISFVWPRNRCFTYRYIVGHRDVESHQKAKFLFEDILINSDRNGSFLESLKFSL